MFKFIFCALRNAFSALSNHTNQTKNSNIGWAGYLDEDRFEAFCRLVGEVERPSDEQQQRAQRFRALKDLLDAMDVGEEDVMPISDDETAIYETDPNNSDFVMYSDGEEFEDDENDLDYVAS